MLRRFCTLNLCIYVENEMKTKVTEEETAKIMNGKNCRPHSTLRLRIHHNHTIQAHALYFFLSEPMHYI